MFAFPRQNFAETKPANTIIDESWIKSLEDTINKSYPETPKYTWQQAEYQKEYIDWPYIQNTEKNETYWKYNPFDLRLPYPLESYERLFDRSAIRDDERYHYNNSISRNEAAVASLNLLKEYNLAYITFLKAINGSIDAEQALKELFTTNLFFERVHINTKTLNSEIDWPSFITALLAYITLNIVYSPEKNIGTRARIKALEFIRDNFEVEKVAKTFQKFELGYYAWDEKNEPLYNMIPKRFVTNATEAGGTAHNNLFLKNAYIKKIFNVTTGYNGSINFDAGIATMLNKYPAELLQVLQSLMKCDIFGMRIDRKFIFLTLVSLSKLDGIQKGQIFGEKASFRNNGQSSLESRADWFLGKESFGNYLSEDELNSLSTDDLKTRVRQQAYRITQLEHELVEKEKPTVLQYINVNNDPKGYYACLLLHPDTPEDNFEELLTRHYRVLALKYHPDKVTGNKDKFQQLNEAYEFLKDAANRRDYRTIASMRPKPY